LFSASEPGRGTEWWDGETGIFFKICCICREIINRGKLRVVEKLTRQVNSYGGNC